jgi:hypothetical protein
MSTLVLELFLPVYMIGAERKDGSERRALSPNNERQFDKIHFRPGDWLGSSGINGMMQHIHSALFESTAFLPSSPKGGNPTIFLQKQTFLFQRCRPFRRSGEGATLHPAPSLPSTAIGAKSSQRRTPNAAN